MLKVVVYRMLEKSNENLKFSGKSEAGKWGKLKKFCPLCCSNKLLPPAPSVQSKSIFESGLMIKL